MAESAQGTSTPREDDREETVKGELLTDLAPYPETLRELGFEERLQAVDGTLRVWSMKAYPLHAAIPAGKEGWSRFAICAVALVVDSVEPSTGRRLSANLQAIDAEGRFAGSLAESFSPPADVADNSFLRELDATLKIVEHAQVRPADVYGLCCTILNAAQGYRPVVEVLRYPLIKHFQR